MPHSWCVNIRYEPIRETCVCQCKYVCVGIGAGSVMWRYESSFNKYNFEHLKCISCRFYLSRMRTSYVRCVSVCSDVLLLPSCVARNQENCFYCLRFQFSDLFIILSASLPSIQAIDRETIHFTSLSYAQWNIQWNFIGHMFVQRIPLSGNTIDSLHIAICLYQSTLPEADDSSSLRSYSHLINNYFLIYVLGNCITILRYIE